MELENSHDFVLEFPEKLFHLLLENGEKLVFKQNVTLKRFNYRLRGVRISGLRRLGLRVGCPFVGHALKVTDGRPPEVFP